MFNLGDSSSAHAPITVHRKPPDLIGQRELREVYSNLNSNPGFAVCTHTSQPHLTLINACMQIWLREFLWGKPRIEPMTSGLPHETYSLFMFKTILGFQTIRSENMGIFHQLCYIYDIDFFKIFGVRKCGDFFEKSRHFAPYKYVSKGI